MEFNGYIDVDYFKASTYDSEVNHIFEADINGNNISNGKVYDDSDEPGTFTGSRN